MGERGRYLTIQEWMLTLGLKPSELMAFALIYGFCQDGKSVYKGSSEYIAYWLGLSQTATLSVLARLTDKGLVGKIERKVGSVKYVDYKVSPKVLYRTRKLSGTAQETCAAKTPKTCAVTAQETYAHNNTHNKKDINMGDIDLSLDETSRDTMTIQQLRALYEN